MTSSLRRHKVAVPNYTVIQETQHWRLLNGRWHRDVVVRLADGSLRLYAFPETESVAA